MTESVISVHPLLDLCAIGLLLPPVSDDAALLPWPFAFGAGSQPGWSQAVAL